MDKKTLKKYFPFSFKKKKTGKDLLINLLIYVLAGMVAGAVIGIFARVPVVNLITGLAGAAVELYVLVGIVLSVLDYKKLLKQGFR